MAVQNLITSYVDRGVTGSCAAQAGVDESVDAVVFRLCAGTSGPSSLPLASMTRSTPDPLTLLAALCQRPLVTTMPCQLCARHPNLVNRPRRLKFQASSLALTCDPQSNSRAPWLNLSSSLPSSSHTARSCVPCTVTTPPSRSSSGLPMGDAVMTR